MNCIFLGVPGAGKGTQAKSFSDKKSLYYIGTGEILRDHVSRRTPLGIKVKNILDGGHLVDDAIMIQIIEEEVKEKDSFILDGFPRTVPQAIALDDLFLKLGKKLECVFFLDVPDDEVIKRMLGRRSCGSCGRDYNIYLSDITDGRCSQCGGELVRRSDDTDETVKERISEYRKKTAPLKEYYKEKNLLRELDGTGGISDVFERIIDAAENRA